jgi:hypothetical protein
MMASEEKGKGGFRELGVTGLKHRGGYIQEEFLPELQGPRGMKVYREMMDNSAAVGACLGAIEMLCRQVTWYVQPALSKQLQPGIDVASPEDFDRARFVGSCLRDMSSTWSDTLTDVLTMLGYGFAPQEIVYKERRGDVVDPAKRSKYSDGLIGWRKLPIRAQETVDQWELDDAGGVQGLYQVAPPKYDRRFLPIEKLLLFRARAAKNNPEGRSILRTAYRSYYYEKRIVAIEGMGIERDLAGLPVVGIPAACMTDSADDEQRAQYTAAKKLATGLRRDEFEGMVKPIAYEPGTSNQLYSIELLTTGGRRQFDTTAILQQKAREIVMSMIYDLLLMGQPNVMQYKGANMPTFFATSLGAWLDSVCDVFNMFAIPRLYRMNGWSVENLAELKHGDVQLPDLAALGDYISKLSGAKMPLFPDDSLENHLRRIAGLPDRGAARPGQGPSGGPDNPDDPGEDPEEEPAPPVPAPADEPAAAAARALVGLEEGLLRAAAADVAFDGRIAAVEAAVDRPPNVVNVNVTPGTKVEVTNQVPAPKIDVHVPSAPPTPVEVTNQVHVAPTPPTPVKVTNQVNVPPACGVTIDGFFE